MSDVAGLCIDPTPFADTPAFATLLAFCDRHRDEALAALPWAVA